ncbi:MAG: hypothetical protein ACOVOV_15100, partial [Dolichospermum sp.]
SSASFVGTGTFSSTVTATAFIVTGSGVPSNGIYLSAANTLALSSGSSQRMILNSSGNIGINTNAPVGRLHVHHSSDTDSRIVVTNSTTGNGSVGAEKGFHVVEQGNNTYLFNYQNGPIIFGTNGTENGGFRLNAGGNVGLGNTNNTYKLEVTGTTKLDGTLLTTGAATFSGSVTATSESTVFKEGFIVKATTTSAGGSQPAYTYYTAAGSKRWSTFLNVGDDKFHIAGSANTELFTIQQNGNVGIGVTDVKENFEVAANWGNLRLYGRGGIRLNNLSNNLYYNGSAWVRDNASYGAQSITFDTNGAIIFENSSATSGDATEKMRITSGGNVGIGTPSPASLLSILRGSSGDNMELIGSGASGYSDILFYNTNKVARLGYIDWSDTQARWNVEANIPLILYTNSSERMRITSGGLFKFQNNGSSYES